MTNPLNKSNARKGGQKPKERKEKTKRRRRRRKCNNGIESVKHGARHSANETAQRKERKESAEMKEAGAPCSAACGGVA